MAKGLQRQGWLGQALGPHTEEPFLLTPGGHDTLPPHKGNRKLMVSSALPLRCSPQSSSLLRAPLPGTRVGVHPGFQERKKYRRMSEVLVSCGKWLEGELPSTATVARSKWKQFLKT